MNDCCASTKEINHLLVRLQKTSRGGVELHLCPQEKAAEQVAHRSVIEGRPECRQMQPVTVGADSVVQLKLAQDTLNEPFIGGATMQESMTVLGLKADEVQEADQQGISAETLVVALKNETSGVRVCQYIEPTAVAGTLRMWSKVTNIGNAAVDLEYLTSFVLSGLTPFASDDAPGRLKLHRFRSWWSNEGQGESVLLEDLHLVRNWAGISLPCERFGQMGTMPVRGFFPFVGIEDTVAGVCWGAQLCWAGSWQMEVTRRADTVSICGGLADYETGHWVKSLKPGESLQSPVAHVACVAGGLSELTAKLVQLQESLLKVPPQEEDLPVVFNEWCTNWGSPSHDKTIKLAERLKGSGVRYIVIDDGWALRPADAKSQSNGDWIVDTEKFPHGMAATCEAIREMGFIPGVWFEFEVCNPGSQAFERVDHHLHRHGRVLLVGSRRFWNLRDPWVVDYLEQKVVRFLKDNGFGYLKVDYNNHIGVGCDHPDSLGEGSRQQVEGIYKAFERIRDGVQDIVIENCSSGGHRLEPSMMALTSMSSFSDAHESTNIPIIARQLHHLMPPRQSQIWAVLYPDDSVERFMYSLTATFYGRMCLSGPVHELGDGQMQTLHRAVGFYKQVAPLIKEGTTHYLGDTPQNWRDPVGHSGVLRISRDGKQALVVLHEYERVDSGALILPLPIDGRWTIQDSLTDGTTEAPSLEAGALVFSPGKDFRGYALLLKQA